AHLAEFNAYLTRVSSLLRLGRTESRLAVYFPNEDNCVLGRIPDSERTPGACYRWEMRHVIVPREVEGYAPLWVSSAFLHAAEMRDGLVSIGDCTFSAILIDVEWLDGAAVREILRLAQAGLRVILPRVPGSPGRIPFPEHAELLDFLQAMPNVVRKI